MMMMMMMATGMTFFKMFALITSFLMAHVVKTL